MQVTPRNKQLGRRGKRAPVIESLVEPSPIELSEDERKRRLYCRNW